MAEGERLLQCSILTPEGPVFSGPVVSLVAPALDGEVGILYGHAPLIAVLAAGTLKINLPTGKTQEWLVVGGFLEVLANRVSVLARSLEHAESIDVAQVQRELEEARKLDRHRIIHSQERADITGNIIAIAQARLRHARRYGKDNV